MTIISRNIRRMSKPSKNRAGEGNNTGTVTDELIKVSDSDAKSGYLQDKIISERTYPTVVIEPEDYVDGSQALYLHADSYFSNTLFVDAIYGSDRAGQIESINGKYATLQRAIQEADPGDLIVVSGNMTAPRNILIDKSITIHFLGDFISHDAATAFTVSNATVKFTGNRNISASGQFVRCDNANVEIEGFDSIYNRYGLFYISSGTFRAKNINRIVMRDSSPPRPGFLPRFAFVLSGRGSATIQNVGDILIDIPTEPIHFFGKIALINILSIDIKRGALCFGPNANDEVCLHNIKRIAGANPAIEGFVDAQDSNFDATGSIISNRNTQCVLKLNRCRLVSSNATPIQSEITGDFKLSLKDSEVIANGDHKAIDWQGELTITNSRLESLSSSYAMSIAGKLMANSSIIIARSTSDSIIEYTQGSNTIGNHISHCKMVGGSGDALQFTPIAGGSKLLVNHTASNLPIPSDSSLIEGFNIINEDIE